MRRSRIPTRGRRAPGTCCTQHRELLFRDEARRDPTGLIGRIRREFDAQVLTNKRDMAARGLDRDHVLAVVVNPRVDPGPGWIAVRFDAIPRAEIIAMDTAPELAPQRAALAHPPKPGHVWVFIPIPHLRALIEEPVEHTATDHGATPTAGDA